MRHQNGWKDRIKKNHANSLPRYIIALDTETKRHALDKSGKQFSHNFRLGCAITARIRETTASAIKHHRFRSTDDIWRLISSYTAANYTTWIVAHSVLFDLIVSGLAERFERGEIAIDWPRSKRTREDNDDGNAHCWSSCIIDNPPTIMAFRVAATAARFVIVDTLNWFQSPLKDLGEAIGLPKYDMPNWDESDDTWFYYCQRDCEIVFYTFVELLKWVREKDMGMFRYTGPAQSMSAYRHRFMSKAIYCHDVESVRTIERASYFGGRTECFRYGQIESDVFHLDVCSLFPSVMIGNEYPYALNMHEDRKEWSSTLPVLDWSKTIAEVELETNDNIYPLRRNKSSVYPIGRFRTTLCGPELHNAYSTGCIRQIKSFANYSTHRLFDSWVNELWQMRIDYRTAGNKLYEQFTKRLMNSLYGKFGQLSPEWQNAPDLLAALPWSQWSEVNSVTGERKEFRSIGWQVQVKGERLEMHGTFPAISAFVTSYARIRMNKLREIAGHENIYYQGVDCLLVNTIGHDRLATAGEICEYDLGKFRPVGRARGIEIMGCADYRFGDKVVISGRAKDSWQTENGRILQRRMLTTQLLFAGCAPTYVVEETTPWERHKTYSKGVIQQDGTVKPLTISLDTA